jgi:hypothetical protein
MAAAIVEYMQTRASDNTKTHYYSCFHSRETVFLNRKYFVYYPFK